MPSAFQPLRHATLGLLSPHDAGVLLANARSLQRAAGTVQPHALLRGKNIGLLCAAGGNDDDAALFRGAAADLGAHVVNIPSSLSDASGPEVVRHTARMLGRLYDAVECQGLAAALVRQMGLEAGVPVYDAIASAEHPTARLADQLGGESSPADRRRLLLQAVLVSTIA